MIRYAHAADGCRLAWYRDGVPDAPTLLLCNSIGTDAGMWDPQLDSFGQRYDVIRFDTRGHGRSDAPEGPYRLETLASDALAILDAANVRTAHVCGLSLGGAVALRLALDAPECVGRLIVANSAAKIGSPEAWQARMDVVLSQGLDAIADMAMARFFDGAFRAARPEVVDRFRRMLLSHEPKGYVGCCAALRDSDLRRRIPELGAPILLIAGSKDVSTPLSQLRAIADLVPGARLVELDAAHLSNVELPEAFAQAVDAFLVGA